MYWYLFTNKHIKKLHDNYIFIKLNNDTAVSDTSAVRFTTTCVLLDCRPTPSKDFSLLLT